MLLSACWNQDLKKIKSLIKKGTDIHAFNDEALRIAILNANLSVIRFLIENGVSVKANDNFALLYSIKNGNLDVIKLLFEFDNYENEIRMASIESVKYDNLEVVKYIIAKRANNYRGLLKYAALNNNLKIVSYLVENGANVNGGYGKPLLYSVRKGNLEIVSYLVENGANINNKILIESIENGQLNIIKYLMDNGAKLCLYDYKALICDEKMEIIKILLNPNTRNRILYDAVYCGKLEIIHYCVEHGANINSYYDLLLTSINQKHYDVSKYLIENEITFDVNNYNLLLAAVNSGILSIVVFLVEHGLKRRAMNIDQDDKECKALLNSSKNGHFEIFKYLVEQEANSNYDYNKELILSSKYEHEKIVRYLIEYGKFDKYTLKEVLRIAVCGNNLELVKYLVNNGADIYVNHDEVLESCSISDNLEIINFLVENGAIMNDEIYEYLLKVSLINIKIKKIVRFIENYKIRDNYINVLKHAFIEHYNVDFLLLLCNEEEITKMLYDNEFKNDLISYLLKKEISLFSIIIQAYRNIGIDLFDMLENEKN